jgi:pimeloyl-ACP methyl ester carboxylesterase
MPITRSPAAPNLDRTRIVVAGHSLGGFIAAYLAGHDRRLAGAALISAARYLGEVVFLSISSIGGSTPLLRSKSRNAT